MLSLLPKILFYKMFYKIGFPKILPMNYTFSLLNSCNSRCNTCNIYDKRVNNLTLNEYEKLFKSIGKSPFWATMSGGEPFLRKDIREIIMLLYTHCQPSIINIPTNGILTDKILKNVEHIAQDCPKSEIVINLSIDGIGVQHDKIRNVRGNFQKVTTTFNRLKELKEKKHINNLSLGIHTVISKFNVDDFPVIAGHLMSMEPDSYITEIAENRIELDTMDEDISPSKLAYVSAADFLIHNIKQKKNLSRMARITQAFRIEYYKLVKNILREETQIIPCYSGIASVQISPDGEVWPCCVRAENIGNLRKNDFDFKKIWTSKKAKKARKFISRKKCHCPLANASYTNMLMHFPTLFRVFYRAFLKWWT